MLSWMSSPYMNPIINQKQLEPSLITHHTLPLLWVKMATPSVAGLTESPWWLFCSMEGKDSWSNLLQTLFVLYALNVDVIWASVCRKLTKAFLAKRLCLRSLRTCGRWVRWYIMPSRDSVPRWAILTSHVTLYHDVLQMLIKFKMEYLTRLESSVMPCSDTDNSHLMDISRSEGIHARLAVQLI